MKKIQNLLALVMLVCTVVACQKEGSVELGTGGSGNSGGRAKTYTEMLVAEGDTESVTFNLSYDNAGRLISMASATTPGDKYIYTFPSADKYTLDIYTSGVVDFHTDFFLTAGSFVDSSFSYSADGDTTANKVVLDAAGRPVTVYYYEYSGTNGIVLAETVTNEYDANNNLIREVSSLGEEVRYEFYTDAKHPQPYFLGPINAYSDKEINLKKTSTASAGGIITISAQHTYTFDDQRRIVTEKIKISDELEATKSYTY